MVVGFITTYAIVHITIVFLYDDSGSVGKDPANFVLMKNFMKHIVGSFSNVGVTSTQFAAACFAHGCI
jgi:hypothetical protein